MGEAFHCVLPWPTGISTNHMYTRRRNGIHVALSPKYRQYRETVATILAMKRLSLPDGHLKVVIDAYEPDRRRRDIDNIIKITLDSIFVPLKADDARVKRLLIAMRQLASRLNEHPRLEVTIIPLDEQGGAECHEKT